MRAEPDRMDRRQRSLVAGLAVTQTVSWGVLYYAFSVLLVPMQDDLGWSRSVLVGGFTAAVVVSGLAAPTVGRGLDRERARVLMTSGSVLGVVAVLAWSQVRSPLPYYAAWLAIGLAMAAVLYDPAFTVLAKRTAPFHRRAITAVTLLAGLASFIFQPLTSVLAERYGWRTTLVVLAVGLAAITVPIHVGVLRAPDDGAGPAPARDRARPPELADPRFWRLTAAFAAVTAASMATGVLLVAYLVDQGWSLGRGAFAAGLLGASQLPGRVAFGPMAARVARPVLAAVLMCIPGLGIVVLLVARGGGLVWAAVVVLGLGQGATTLLRPVLLVDLFGTARIGALTGISATPITCTRALAPLAASLAVAATGSYGPAFGALIAASLFGAVVAFRELGGREPVPEPVPAAGVAADQRST